MASVLFGATTLSSCFKDDYNYDSYYNVYATGMITDSISGSAISNIQVIMYRKLSEEQTLATTPDSLLCDTVLSNAYGEYLIGDVKRKSVSLTYGLHFFDTDKRYVTREIEFGIHNISYYFSGGNYTWKYQYSPALSRIKELTPKE